MSERRKKKEQLPDTWAEVERQLTDILLRSKLGRGTTDDENRFAELCYQKWPEEYARLQRERIQPAAFRHVNPFA